MTEAVWIALVSGGLGIVGVLLGVILTQHYETKKKESEEKRWYADYFLKRKIDKLEDLFAALVDCHFTLNFYGNYPPASFQEYKEQINPKEEAYLKAKVIASVYLDKEGDKIMSEALGAFRQASGAIGLQLPEMKMMKDSASEERKNMDWKRFSDTYDKATAWFKDKLNPQVLSEIENKGGLP